jgi:hypothetical protein
MRLSLLLISLFVAGQAEAQIVGRHDYGPSPRGDPFLEATRVTHPSVRDDLRDVRRDIRQARDSGAISNREARRMMRDARAIGRLAYHQAQDGLSESEATALRARTAALRSIATRPPPADRRRARRGG